MTFYISAEAAKERYKKPVESSPDDQPSSSCLHYEVPRLTALIVRDVSNRICDTRNPILSLQGMPAEVAYRVLEHLIKEKLLRPKTLNPFVSW